MTSATERLNYLVSSDREFTASVDGAFHNILRLGGQSKHVLVFLASTLCSRYGLSAEVHNDAVVLWNSLSRAPQPSAIVLSMDAGQPASPNACLVRRTGTSLIQVFEGGADDTPMAGHCPQPTHRLQTKGRMLLH